MALPEILSLPTNIGIASITITAQNAVAISQSPFTYAQQVIKHRGERWSASISLPPMLRVDAEPWVAFLLALGGPMRKFYLGDPNCKVPQGSAKTTAGTPVVNGADQTGASLNVRGLPTSVTGYLKAGDYIQLGASATATLHKVLMDVNTDSSGTATLEIWPALRSATIDGATIVLNNTVGRFRLSGNMQQWQINDVSSYGITFDCVEAL
jgi:hypothetical protein